MYGPVTDTDDVTISDDQFDVGTGGKVDGDVVNQRFSRSESC